MSDWIEHDGKGMPVDGDTKTEVKFRDGEFMGFAFPAKAWHSDDPSNSNWVQDGSPEDIIAYRIVK